MVGTLRETGSTERVCTIPEGKDKMTRSKLTKGLVAGAAAVATAAGLAAVPTAASAQTAPYYGSGYGYNNTYYDPCRRDTSQRATAGGLTGAAIGAAIGSGIAARGVRTEGAVLGGLLGAAIGAKVGTDTAACRPGAYPQTAPQSSYGTSPYYGSGYGYAPAPYTPAPARNYGYNTPYGYGDDDGYYGGYGYPVNNTVGADGCTLAESPIYLPDGRTQKRFVRVCRDSSGRYQVVD
jgi:hypothetical protein